MTDLAKDVSSSAAEECSRPVTIEVDAYLSENYARAERDKLWRKVWQQVGRVEELPEVGSYLTYDILDDSIIVVRTGPGEFRAHHNVCMHRGRRLIDKPAGAKNACARTRKSFVCGFHGWTYNLEGACTHIREQDDWMGALSPDDTHLRPVSVDTWGGWLWINMDPDCEPLADYLFPAAKLLEPFGLENMRYKWRKWLEFDCNWKVALEAFNETYHSIRRIHSSTSSVSSRAGPKRRASTAISATTPRTISRRRNPRSGSAPATTRGCRPPRCRPTSWKRPTPPRPRRW